MVKYERFTNAASTTLNGAINDTTTSITVTDGSVFPADGNFRIAIENEILNVTARSTNTLTVVRGAESTTGAAHADTTAVTLIITGSNVEGWFREHGSWFQPTVSLSGWSNRGRLLNDSDTTLTGSGSFTRVGLSTVEVVDQGWGGVVVSNGALGIINIEYIYKAAPSTPYTLISHMSIDDPSTNGNGGNFVVTGFEESSTGKLLTLGCRPYDNLAFARWTNRTTFASTNTQTAWVFRYDVWTKFTNDGTTISCYASGDGEFWHLIGTETVGSFLTPNRLLWGVDNRDQSNHKFYLNSWLES